MCVCVCVYIYKMKYVIGFSVCGSSYKGLLKFGFGYSLTVDR